MKFRHLLILFLFLLNTLAYSQTEAPTFQLHVEGTITNLDDTPQPGVSVQVMQGGKVLFNSTTDGTGSYSFDLPLNSDYSIIVSKPGFATKKYSVSTRGVPPERATSKFSTIEASLSIFEKVEGIDYSMLNQPLNKYTYNATKENFEYDKAYLDQMLGGLQALMAQQQAALNRLKELEKNYQAAIKNGDKAFQKNDWAAAKAAYAQATSLKPNEAWPKEQLVQIDKIIKEQEALNKKKEEDAKKAAEEAKKAAAAAELNAKYAAAIKKGDDAFNAKGWAAAKLGYNEAIGLKPGEQYPKDKLAAIDKAIADEAAAKNKAELDAKYNAAIKKGDDAFNAKGWAVAKLGYNEALGFKPAEQYPKDKLAAIDKAIADEAAAKNKAETDAKYTAAIKKGDDGFAKKDWPNAKAGYNEALGVKPSEQYPKDKIAAIDKAIADEAAAKAKADADAKAKAEAEAKYLAAVKRGDDGFAKKDWSNAKAAYTEASGLKPAEQYPKTQLAAIEKALADDAAAKAKADADAKAKAELDAKYAAAIKKGDDAFNTKNWVNAKAGYNEALGIKSSEQYPKDKLAAIDKAIADENAAKSKAELDAKYSAAIKKGDEAFAKKDWPNAKAGYNEALGVKPNEQYPKDKIAAIDKAIADDAAAKAKADADAKSKAELEAKYAAAIKKGDDGFGKKDWSNAKVAYTEASGLKPAEQYPKTQIAAIDKLLADEAAAKAKAEADAKAKAELEAKYAAAIKKGDDAFGKKDWPTARTGYNEALGFKPAEQYPKTQLAAIEKAIADEKANMDAAAKAKAEAELNAKYQEAIKRADDGFAKKDWNNSKSAYNQALGLKPAEKYPKDQIAIIDKNLADEAAAKAKTDADAKAKAELEAKYIAAIKKGDDGFNTKNWAAAKSGFTDALAIKPGEQYPKDKLAAIEKAIADENANKSKAELEAKYNAALKKGDDAFAKKDWANAKMGYTDALGIKPTEQYPKDKLAAIDKAIADENANKSKAEIEAKYAAAIKKGDDGFAKKDWANAKAGYNDALGIKPAEQYPKDKLAAIDKAIADENANKSKAEIDAKYNAALKKGDDAFAKKDWTNAKAGYNDALGIKPSEQYPKDKLAAIDKAIADENANKSKAEIDAKYNAALKKGDDAFAKKDWTNAKAGYNDALGIKPSEQYPKDKLAAIDKAIADENANKSKAEIDAKYAAAIKIGDDAFAKKDWANARMGYTDASGIKPGEQYPKDKLAAIDKAIADENTNKSKGETDAKYNAAIKKGDEAFGKKDWATAKAGYTEASIIKSGEQYPKDKLAAIDSEIAKLEAAKSAAELKAKYDAAIKKADALFAKKSWADSKAAYYEALEYMPDEKYPKMQIGAINKAMSGTAPNPTDQKYKDAISKADNYFGGKQYKEAKPYYEEALTYKGGDPYAKSKLLEIEKLLHSDASVKTDEHKKALLAKYKEGVTEEIITGTGVTIIQRVVVRQGDVWVYQKKIFTWGGIAYFRDGATITELIFEHETNP